MIFFKLCSREGCRRQGQELPIVEFRLHKNKKFGLDSYCKECADLYTQKRIEKNKSKTKEQIFNNQPQKCISCKMIKTRTKENWGVDLSKTDGLSTLCKECTNFKRKNSLTKAISGLIFGAEERKLKVELSKEQLMKEMAQPCYYCKEINNIEHYDKRDPVIGNFNSLDRVDNGKGYVQGNVVSCCWRHNGEKNQCTLALAKCIVKFDAVKKQQKEEIL